MSPFAVTRRALACSFAPISALAGQADCGGDAVPKISFISFTSPNLLTPAQPLAIKGKLSIRENVARQLLH